MNPHIGILQGLKVMVDRAVILITDRFARAAALTPSICRARLVAKLKLVG
jgi:hypothetical protein